jgi:hypothetical protein
VLELVADVNETAAAACAPQLRRSPDSCAGRGSRLDIVDVCAQSPAREMVLAPTSPARVLQAALTARQEMAALADGVTHLVGFSFPQPAAEPSARCWRPGDRRAHRFRDRYLEDYS